jgi:cell division protein ZapE
MQLADLFDTVLISNVPLFSGKLIPAVFSGVEDSYQRSGVLMGNLRQLDDEARRFIALVDEFYDRKIQLIVCADGDISELYQGQQLSFEFQRCQSRLFEMQNDYWL